MDINVATDVKPTETKEIQDLRKRAGVPEIDPDALPSSYAVKMNQCATKHVKRLADLISLFKAIKDPTDIQIRKLCAESEYI